jgi:two-component system response regulator DesR
MSIRVFIVEDQAMVRGALAALLGMETDFEIVGEAPDGQAALTAIESVAPDVVLTDIEMPEMTGLELAAALAERAAASRVVILTTFARAGYLRRAMDAGVRGYLLKDAPADVLADSIRRVAAGETAVDPELARLSWQVCDPLTDRERQALRLASEGLSTSRIAGKLHLSAGTVRNYVSTAISKMGASNRVEAARIARREGLL